MLELKQGTAIHGTGLESFYSWSVNTTQSIIMALDRLQLLR